MGSGDSERVTTLLSETVHRQSCPESRGFCTLSWGWCQELVPAARPCPGTTSQCTLRHQRLVPASAGAMTRSRWAAPSQETSPCFPVTESFCPKHAEWGVLAVYRQFCRDTEKCLFLLFFFKNTQAIGCSDHGAISGKPTGSKVSKEASH